MSAMPHDQQWLLDSGATRHITADRSLFVPDSFKPLQNGRQVTVVFGNGTSASATGTGTILLRGVRSSGFDSVSISNVLYVPDANVHLISVKLLDEKGLSTCFASSAAHVSKPGRGTLLRFMASSAGYVMPFTRPPGSTASAAVASGASPAFPSATSSASPSPSTSSALPAKPPSPAAPSTPTPATDEQVSAATASTQQLDDADLWHRRYAHLAHSGLQTLVKNDMVTGISVPPEAFAISGDKTCEICITSKLPRKPFPPSSPKSSRPLELVHMDVNGPLPVTSLGGSCYMATFLDDYSDLSVVRFVKFKSDIPDTVMSVFNLLETQTELKLKAVRTDRGSEYLNDTLDSYFNSKGVKHETSAPYTPQQNGKAERLNRTIMDRVRAMLQESKLPANLWAEAANTACSIRNVSPSSGNAKTPFERFWSSKPDVSQLRVFGCPAFVRVPKELRNKLQPIAVKGIFVGYQPGSKAYRVLVNGTVRISRDVTFDEHRSRSSSTSPLPASDSDSDESGGAPGSDNDDDNMPNASPPLTRTRSGDDNPSDGGRYPKRPHQPPREYWRNSSAEVISNSTAGVNVAITASPSSAASSSDIAEPATYKQALASPQAEQWRAAANDEYASLMTNKTWELMPLPPGYSAIPSMWVFKLKRNADGSIERFKARLVVKGYMQREGVDFNEVFAPVCKHATLRTLLAKAAAEDLHIAHLDIKTAFLNGDLEETIYMKQPEGYVSDPSLVCHLRKSLYGLKQAPRAWFLKLKSALESIGLFPSHADPGLYIHPGDSTSGPIYMLVYVDDIFIFSSATGDTLVTVIKDALKKLFDVRDLGDASWFLGIELIRDLPNKTIKLVQSRSISELIAKYGLSDANPKCVPMTPGIKLTASESIEPPDGSYPFRELVGSLLYLSVCTRPDISFAVGALARFMSNYTAAHWSAAKDVLRYLSGTINYGLCFNGNKTFELIGFCDADYAGDVNTRRSTTGFAFTACDAALSWSSRLQTTVAVSTAEAEYMAAAAAIKEALWFRTLMLDLYTPLGPLLIYADNQAAIKLLGNPIASARSKHIDIMYHFARDRVARKQVEFMYISTNSMLADVFTKPLPELKFVQHRSGLGVV
jgi:hypothetical protein